MVPLGIVVGTLYRNVWSVRLSSTLGRSLSKTGSGAPIRGRERTNSSARARSVSADAAGAASSFPGVRRMPIR